MRCTQNPSVGEEWRRNWHPETIPTKGSDGNILIVGAGPSGLEAARALGQRGYKVTLAEAKSESGGRVSEESRLPGLAAWSRVRDWRIGRIQQMENVKVYFGNQLKADEIMALDFEHIIVATGSHWRGDGVGISNWQPIPGSELDHVYTPEVVFADKPLKGSVVVFDDDNFYMGALIAEKLKQDGHHVTLVTNATEVSSWTQNTLEQHRIQTHILELGIDVVTTHNLASVNSGTVTVSCIYTESEKIIDANTVILVTSRLPNEELYLDLTEDSSALENASIKSVTAIGDCLCPSTIASAVYEGHRVAREFDAAPENPDMPFRREEISLQNFENQEVNQ